MNIPVLSLDKLVSRALNNWGTREIFLVKVLSEYLVYLVILIASLWLVHLVYQFSKPLIEPKFFCRSLFAQGLFFLVIPVTVATVVSEAISAVIPRKRPFAAMEQIQLLVPHNADGGMPSHHVVFMAAIAFSIYKVNRYLGGALLGVTMGSGIGRIAAGIHYPTDVLVGIFLSGSIVLLSQFVIHKAMSKGSYQIFGGIVGGKVID